MSDTLTPEKQAEIDHYKQKLYLARLRCRECEEEQCRADEELYRLRDKLIALGVDVDAETDEDSEDG